MGRRAHGLGCSAPAGARGTGLGLCGAVGRLRSPRFGGGYRERRVGPAFLGYPDQFGACCWRWRSAGRAALRGQGIEGSVSLPPLAPVGRLAFTGTANWSEAPLSGAIRTSSADGAGWRPRAAGPRCAARAPRSCARRQGWAWSGRAEVCHNPTASVMPPCSAATRSGPPRDPGTASTPMAVALPPCAGSRPAADHAPRFDAAGELLLGSAARPRCACAGAARGAHEVRKAGVGHGVSVRSAAARA